MKTETLTVVWKRIGYAPMTITIPHTTEALQTLVGGYIECVQLNGEFDLWCNEEGRLLELHANIRLPGTGVICGDVFVARHDGEGETLSLTEQEAKDVSKFLSLSERL